MKIHSIHTLSETVSADKPIDAKNKFLNVGGGSSNTGVLLPRDVVESAKTASKSGDSEKESSVARITLYKNAITLNDEDKNFIDCSSEKGQRILKNLKAGSFNKCFYCDKNAKFFCIFGRVIIYWHCL